jgi:hypothetical protein
LRGQERYGSAPSRADPRPENRERP